MTQNKTIAEFMGIHVYEGKSERTGESYFYYNDAELQDFEALPSYESDWNALMPVIVKLNGLSDNPMIITPHDIGIMYQTVLILIDINA